MDWNILSGMNNQYQYFRQHLTTKIAQELIQELFAGQTIPIQEIKNKVDEVHRRRGGLLSRSKPHHPVTYALSKMKRMGFAENPTYGFWSILPGESSRSEGSSDNVLTETCQWLEALIPTFQDRINLIQEEIDRRALGTGSKDQILVVRIRGEAPILREDQAKTFGLVIETLGIEAVRSLGKTVGKDPLISMKTSSNPNIQHYRSGPYFIKTTMSCGQKKRLLEEIASELRPPVPIQVDIYKKVRT